MIERLTSRCSRRAADSLEYGNRRSQPIGRSLDRTHACSKNQ